MNTMLGDRVKKLRKQKDKTQAELSKALELSLSMIGMIETNKREVSNAMLIKIADYFDVSVDYLLGRTDNPKGIIVNDNIDDNEIEIEVDKDIYPAGLTHEEVLEVLEKLKELGIDWEKFKKK